MKLHRPGPSGDSSRIRDASSIAFVSSLLLAFDGGQVVLGGQDGSTDTYSKVGRSDDGPSDFLKAGSPQWPSPFSSDHPRQRTAGE